MLFLKIIWIFLKEILFLNKKKKERKKDRKIKKKFGFFNFFDIYEDSMYVKKEKNENNNYILNC